MQVKQSPNILNWYQFKKEDLVLIIGNEIEEVAKMLKEKCKKVKTIGNTKIEEYNENFLYDYIILIGINEKAKELTNGNLKLTRCN